MEDLIIEASEVKKAEQKHGFSLSPEEIMQIKDEVVDPIFEARRFKNRPKFDVEETVFTISGSFARFVLNRCYVDKWKIESRKYNPITGKWKYYLYQSSRLYSLSKFKAAKEEKIFSKEEDAEAAALYLNRGGCE